ncbi:26S proteasome non-ATPase regulatory subunit 9 [Trichonephila clavipes]|uniref:26S proteasome non-ATPase regulatory subunit 9 n=2 Tax=Trichonephila TaxID=2585208 RepID=A0A8X6LW91_TRICU|nr:26S proteasome non-ATPase regulatory subunit 9 [Trichonephila clavata]GFV81131.1 26S proteasome non-ATPase regulatory subunit 9 [Trichonephila clavipes]GFY71472.1 26S proteasome non-ATPase regulatory subunit 9 [Trichonephila inaurata madagascariensis]
MANQHQDVRANLTSLVNIIGKRDIIEAEILNLLAELKKQNVTMTEPLVDEEGYPRSDVDVAAIRHIRHEIICKQNDCKELTKKIEEDLYALHAEEKITPSASCLNVREVSFKPFARVDLVDENSPAQKADLRVGDLLVKFGSLKFRNFENLSAVAKLVTENLRKPIHVSVLRCDKIVPLILIPDQWSGNGYLGCRIQPIDL